MNIIHNIRRPVQLLYSTYRKRRIGYDGTTQTPSVQLLRPTASSLGHRVVKTNAAASSQQTQSNPYYREVLNTKSDEGATEVSYFDYGNKLRASSTSLDPFEKLNNSRDSTNDMDDEFAFNLVQNFDARNGGKVSKPSSVQSPMHSLGLKRATSWSPGYVQCPERLRVHNIDPVASQLLRACAVSEEEEQGQGTILPLSISSYEIGRIPEADTLKERSKMPIMTSNNSGNPDQRVVVAPSTGRSNGQLQTEERPLSPKPFFSSNLTSSGANSLARPVPRRSSMPAVKRSAYL